MPLRRASNDSRDISQAALSGLQAIFRPGYRYAKAGVMLLDLRPADLIQQELALDDEVADPGGSRLMQALDAVNQRFGRNTVSLASAGLAGEPRQWCMKHERRTPGYTTDWDGLEVDLLAAELLERVITDTGHVVVRLTDAGIHHLAKATPRRESDLDSAQVALTCG